MTGRIDHRLTKLEDWQRRQPPPRRFVDLTLPPLSLEENRRFVTLLDRMLDVGTGGMWPEERDELFRLLPRAEADDERMGARA